MIKNLLVSIILFFALNSYASFAENFITNIKSGLNNYLNFEQGNGSSRKDNFSLCIEQYARLPEGFINNTTFTALCRLKNSGIIDFNLLYSSNDQCDRKILLLGESHIVPANIYIDDLNEISSSFPLMMYEDTSQNDDTEKIVGLKKLSEDYLATTSFPNSAVNNSLMGKSIVVDVHEQREWAEILEDLHFPSTFSTRKREKISNMLVKAPIEVVSDPGSMLNHFISIIGTREFINVNLPLENGLLENYDYDCSSMESCMNWISTGREIRMIKNIIKIHKALPCNRKIALLTGKKHIYGLTLRLLKTNDFLSSGLINTFEDLSHFYKSIEPSLLDN